MIKWFNDIDKDDLSLVGGKALNLGLMYQNGFNVPKGFVVTSEAYDAYVLESKLRDEIEDIINGDLSLSEKARSIKNMFSIDRVSGKLKTLLLESFRDLSAESVAVRSSSTVEDLPGISFAGQYSSFLNVKADNVVERIVDCWQSLWNERAIDYRKRNHITGNFSHCIIVQEMVKADVSGIIFTANPINGLRNQVSINSSFGLGEAIVSGKVNPDQFTLCKVDGKIISNVINVKDEKAVYGHNGIDYVEVENKEESSLNEKFLNELLDVSIKLESYFGNAQDIEFSIDSNDNLFILQSREITTLFPIDQLDQDDKLRPYIVASTVLLAMKEAFTPLGADLYGGMFPKVLQVMTGRKKPVTDSFVKYNGGRILLDISYMMSSKFVAKQFANAFSGNDLPLKGVFAKLLDDHGNEMAKQGIKFKIPWGMFKYALGFISKMKEARKVEADKKYDAVKSLGREFYNERLEKSKDLQTIEETWDFCEETMINVFQLTQKQALYCTEVQHYLSIEKTLKKMFSDKYNIDVLGYVLPDCYTVEMSLKMNQIAKNLVESNESLKYDHPLVKDFVDHYGVRANVELDVGYKRWREDPHFILDQIQSFMDNGMYERNLEEHQKRLSEVNELINNIHVDMVKLKGKRNADKFKKKILAYRRAAGMREYPKFNIVQAIDLLRGLLVKQGAIMVSKGYIDNEKDIFFLNKSEIILKEDLRERVNQAKTIYLKEMRRNSIPRIVMNTGETYYTSLIFDKNSKVLKALPLSSGIYEGRVRVVHDPSNSDLKEGEIMVAESTNPSWTPLFMKAKGLILEYGGPLSHGGIVAREFGIPAVVGITSVTSMLRNGQLVRVNGEMGTVEILEE